MKCFGALLKVISARNQQIQRYLLVGVGSHRQRDSSAGVVICRCAGVSSTFSVTVVGACGSAATLVAALSRIPSALSWAILASSLDSLLQRSVAGANKKRE